MKSFQVFENGQKQSIAFWKSKCKANGGVLASIKSSEDQKMIEEALKKTSKRSVMIGIERSPRNLKYFVDQDQEPITYA